jgi:predicted AlkP superfamily phosphohydrolase/phosphomutase
VKRHANNPPGVDRRDFMRLLAGSAAAAGISAPLASCGAGSQTDKTVIVLGLDGLDPKILASLMEMGRLPNFKKLAEMGSLQPLGTTMPALSPVAWSSFITGMTPGGHGIADFIARDPASYTPVFAIYENTEPDLTISIGDVHLPIKGGGPNNLRRGKPFWAYLTERDIPAWISKIPTNFPVEETATKAIAGMGTPDLVDSYGVFSYYTSDPFEDYPNLEGGEILYVDVNKNVVHSNLLGPVNSLVTPKDTTGDKYANTVKIPFTVYLDPKADGARLDIQGQSILLKRGEYSPWVTVTFDLLPVIGSVQGIARFLLKGVAPHFQLYVTPINIDPSAQAAPVTYPAEFGAEIARDIGAFWTKGLPADVKAFDHKVINDEEYVGQADLILKERMALFDHQWSRFDGGLFYFYVSSTDQDAHMMWRNMDKTHPKHHEADIRFAGWIPHLYEEMDKLVAKALPAVDDNTLVLVCSDHGFAQFARQFHLNTWLRDNGYLKLKDGRQATKKSYLRDIDWSQTRAFGLGLGGIYINQKGREAEGIVEPGEPARALMREIADKLTGTVDQELGEVAIKQAVTRFDVFHGPYTENAPDVLVGYSVGWRVSWDTAIGKCAEKVFADNLKAWSGDHCLHPDLVPGILFSSLKLRDVEANIIDLAPTTLELFGVETPKYMDGKSLLCSEKTT